MRRFAYGFLAAALAVPLAAQSGIVPASAAGSTALIPGSTPGPVMSGSARATGQYANNASINIDVGLKVRNSARLDALIAAASTPGNPQYGHYLTNAQYMAQYAPTTAQARIVSIWLKSRGISVTGVSPDNLLVYASGSTDQVESAFGVHIKSYSYQGKSFYANDADPTAPAALGIGAISGLTNFNLPKPAITCTPTPGSVCGYDGSDFRSAYDVVGDGSGQTIGFTLWGRALPQSDFTGYAAATGTVPLTIGQAGADGLDFIPVGGPTLENDTDGEVALDTQTAHAVAPGIHETYWLGHNNSWATLDQVVNLAANSSISVISNSWGAQSNPCGIQSAMETSLQHGAATGKTFYFSSGDLGASSGCSFPAVSQYVVAVGGTSAYPDGHGGFTEKGVNNGGGCLTGEPRPVWQTGIGTANTWPSTACTGRAEPDISAASGYCTGGGNCGAGSYLYLDGSPSCCWGGTSMATPIWAAGTAVWNSHNEATGRPDVGFIAPLIYSLANNATLYPRDFHDITTGTNGFAAATGWDEATGWGTPDFDKMSNNLADISYSGPTAAKYNDTITVAATLTDHGTTNGLSGRTIYFGVAGESCNDTTNASGYASCSVTVADPLGSSYSVIAAFGGDAAYKAASVTNPFAVVGGDLTVNLSVPPPYTQYTLAHIWNNGSPAGTTSVGHPLLISGVQSGSPVNFSVTADPVILAVSGTNTDIFTGFVPPVSGTLLADTTITATYTSVEVTLTAQRSTGFTGTTIQKSQTYSLLTSQWNSAETAIRQPYLSQTARLAPVKTFACSVSTSLAAGKITTGLASSLQSYAGTVYTALGGVGQPTC